MSARIARVLAATALLAGVLATAVAGPSFEGRKKCSSCHRSQFESWEKTVHAKALDALAPNAQPEAKRKAKLDPNRNYSQDPECVGCHTTGFGHDGGYDPKEPDKYLIGVGCESCHGAGSEYRLLHRKAGQAFEQKKQTTPRQQLADAGQEFGFAERCKACHMNYQGSAWKGARKPYTPFTPKLDKKYAFDFDRAMRDGKAMHEHFKLDGTFTGPPVPALRDEFQSKAKSAIKDQAE